MKDHLTKRLRAVVGMTDAARVVADIGCDHGLVAAALIQEKRAQRVIACDISEASLQKTVCLARKLDIAEQVEPRLGDGLGVLGLGEAEGIVIAGMGGLLIRRILEEGLEKAHAAKQIVCMPHGNEAALRRFLYENGFAPDRERLVFEGGHFYQLLSVRSGWEATPDEVSLLVGKKTVENKDPLLADYLQWRVAKYDHIIERASRGNDTADEVQRLQGLRGRMTEVLKCL